MQIMPKMKFTTRSHLVVILNRKHLVTGTVRRHGAEHPMDRQTEEHITGKHRAKLTILKFQINLPITRSTEILDRKHQVELMVVRPLWELKMVNFLDVARLSVIL